MDLILSLVDLRRDSLLLMVSVKWYVGPVCSQSCFATVETICLYPRCSYRACSHGKGQVDVFDAVTLNVSSDTAIICEGDSVAHGLMEELAAAA
ncbi:MAG: hypothetical protein R3B93_01155 [Bacteroidia bacterium]